VNHRSQIKNTVSASRDDVRVMNDSYDLSSFIGLVFLEAGFIRQGHFAYEKEVEKPMSFWFPITASTFNNLMYPAIVNLVTKSHSRKEDGCQTGGEILLTQKIV